MQLPSSEQNTSEPVFFFRSNVKWYHVADPRTGARQVVSSSRHTMRWSVTQSTRKSSAIACPGASSSAASAVSLRFMAQGYITV